MTYQKIKEKLVEQDKVIEKRAFQFFTIKFAIFVLLGVILLVQITAKTMPFQFTIIEGLIGIFVFLWTFDYICEDSSRLVKMRKAVNLFPVLLVLNIVEYLVLRFFNF